MKRIIAVILAALTLFVFAACGSSEKEVDIAAVKESIVTELGMEGTMDIDSERLLDLYGIAAEDIENSACYVTMDGVFPEEVIMIKASSTDAAKRITEKLNARIEEVKIQSQSYDAQNYALAQECKVITEGRYIAMFLSAKHAQMEELFNSSLK